jgi:hypothetical protein
MTDVALRPAESAAPDTSPSPAKLGKLLIVEFPLVRRNRVPVPRRKPRRRRFAQLAFNFEHLPTDMRIVS